MKKIYVEDAPWLSGAVWTIKRYDRPVRTAPYDEDVAEHVASFILKLVKADREWQIPLYSLTDHVIEEAMATLIREREHTLRAELVVEEGEVFVE